MVAEGATGSGLALADEEDWPVFGERSAMQSYEYRSVRSRSKEINGALTEGRKIFFKFAIGLSTADLSFRAALTEYLK